MKKNYIILFFISSLFLLSFTGGPDDDIDNNITEDSIVFKNFHDGIPYSSFFTNNNLIDKRIFSISQDTSRRYILANRRGLICFNSTNYNFIKTPGMPYKVSRDPYTNRIYVACNNSFGYLSETDSNYVYTEISNKVEKFIGNIDIFFTEKTVTFFYKNYIITVQKEDYSKLNIIKPKPNEFFGGIFQISNINFVFIKNKGGYRILENGISDTLLYPIARDIEITFSLHYDDKDIFGTSDNEIFIVKDGKFTIIYNEKIEYLENKIVSGATIIDENIIAISTLNGGLIFLDIEKQKIVSLLNNYIGLPDNEVFTVFKDFTGGLIISNNQGLYRYDMSIPILNFGEYPGLEGNIISTNMLDSTLYVFTTQGVFYLSKAESDEEFKTIVRRTQSSTNNSQNQMNTNIQDNNSTNDQQNESTLKKWAGKVFGKKNNQDDNSNNSNNTDSLNNQTNNTTQVVYYVKQKNTKKQFSELYYIYKKIDGINEKSKQAIVYNNQLIVATNSGLFLITDKKAENILKDEYITKISKSNDVNKFYVATTNILFELDFSTGKPVFSEIIQMTDIEDYVLSIEETNDAIWLGGEGYAYKINKNNYQDIKMYPLSPDFLSKINIQKTYNNINFFIPQGIYKYNSGLDSIVKYKEFSETEADNVYFINSQINLIWTKLENKWKYNSSEVKIDSLQLVLLNLIPSITNINLDENQNLWIVSNHSTIYKILRTENHKTSINSDFKLNIRNISINDSIINSEEINLKYEENLNLKLILESPFYISNDQVMYQFAIGKNNMENYKWSEMKSENKHEFPLNIGTYTYYFRSINILGQISEIKSIKITVKPPFWQTDLFRFGAIIGIFIILAILFLIRQKTLKRRNLHLENTVKIRTAEISKQNEELKTQSDRISIQNEELKTQSDEISEQNEIVKKQRDKIQQSHEYVTQSITYARRIQSAVLPTEKILVENFTDHFILSLPRDVVSGDFFWFKEYKGKLYLSVADCTGHGVPGAFLSMMGTAYLNEIITYKDNMNSGQILDSMRLNVIYSLQEKEDNDIRDGMDMSFLIIDFENMKIDYAGAYNQMYLFRNKELIEYKADRMPVGYSRRNHVHFTNHKISIKKDDIIYLFTDGYQDQFGGTNNRKFLIKNFKKLLDSINDVPLEFQKELLLTAFYDWKKDRFQIDDITVLGLKI